MYRKWWRHRYSIWGLHYIWPLTFSLCNWVFYWGHYQTAALKPNILHTVEYYKYKQGIEIYHNKECILLLWNFPKCNAGVCSRDSFGRYYPSLCNCVCVKPDVVKKAIYHCLLAFLSCTHLNFVKTSSINMIKSMITCLNHLSDWLSLMVSPSDALSPNFEKRTNWHFRSALSGTWVDRM